uniref:Putative secreted peptide n=1 Tax=Anopheles braziliensis TaxID=58242 RepID=A0A2M3ZX80_9DIPT
MLVGFPLITRSLIDLHLCWMLVCTSSWRSMQSVAVYRCTGRSRFFYTMQCNTIWADDSKIANWLLRAAMIMPPSPSLPGMCALADCIQ